MIFNKYTLDILTKITNEYKGKMFHHKELMEQYKDAYNTTGNFKENYECEKYFFESYKQYVNVLSGLINSDITIKDLSSTDIQNICSKYTQCEECPLYNEDFLHNVLSTADTGGLPCIRNSILFDYNNEIVHD